MISSLHEPVLGKPFLIVSCLFSRISLNICRVFCMYCISLKYPYLENLLLFQSSSKYTSVGTAFSLNSWQRNFLTNLNKFCPSFRRLVAAIRYGKRKSIMTRKVCITIASEDIDQVTRTIGFGLKNPDCSHYQQKPKF